MRHALIEQLLKARKRLAVTQAELGHKIGLPQSHISMIEKGETDLRMSSLVEMARVLDFELMLIPKQWVPAIQAMLRGDERIRSLPEMLLDEDELDEDQRDEEEDE